jgi:esterase
VLVDVLPGLKAGRARHIADFINGPASFAGLDELVEQTARFNPARSRSSLRRGILHNAEQQPELAAIIGNFVFERAWRAPA